MEVKISLLDGSVSINYSDGEKPERRKKGKSLLTIPSDYTVVDIETTGHDTRYDYIIEVCCIKYRANSEVARFSSLVQPQEADYDGHFVDDFIEEYTGISHSMLVSSPKFATIANELWNFLDGELLVGHNVNFDINFLYDNFIAYNPDYVLKNDFVDTLRLARKVLPDLKHHRLVDLDEYFSIHSNHHRAEDDCLTTVRVLHELTKIVNDKNIELKVKRYHAYDIDLRTIKAESDEFDNSHPLFDKYCVFTGKLERFTRKDAAQLVVNLGGHCENNVTKKTNFLIVGDFDYSSGVKGGKSTKMKKAEQLILKGQDLQVLTEKAFCDMLLDSAE